MCHLSEKKIRGRGERKILRRGRIKKTVPIKSKKRPVHNLRPQT